MRALVVLALILAVVPAATAQQPVTACSRQCEPQGSDVNHPGFITEGTVNVVMYAHFGDKVVPGSLNTIPPDRRFETDLAFGRVLPTIETHLPVSQANFHFKDMVQMRFCYGPFEQIGSSQWRDHCAVHGPSPGLRFGAGTFPIYVYLSPDHPSSSFAAGVAPEVRVYARMVIGQRAADGTGEHLLAESHPSPATVRMVALPGQPHVFEVRHMLRLYVDQIPAEAMQTMGHSLRIEVAMYQVKNDVAEAGQSIRFHTGPVFMPRVILPIVEPWTVSRDHVRADNGTLHYYVQLHGPLGAYDLDLDRLKVGLRDARKQLPAPTLVDVRMGDHHNALQPILLHYEIPTHAMANASEVTFEMSVPNRQGTFLLTHEKVLPFARFDAAATVPGPSVGAIMLLLGSLFILRRRAQE